MSDISYLRSVLAEEEARNRELHSYMYELSSGVSQAQKEMASCEQQMNNKLIESTQHMQNAHDRILQAHELQAQIDELYVQFKNMELANKKIREANNKKFYDFDTFNTVRKIVQGMLDNLNLGMVSDSVIYKAVEKEHLKVPNYWLTTVLISIMAWKNDDRPLAERAMDNAIRLDKKNASIFYMLFNIRMGREEAARKWFKLYQECDLKGEDEETFVMLFSMLTQTVKDNIDSSIKYEVDEYIHRTMEENMRAENYSRQEILDQIERYLNRMHGSEELQLNMLKRCLKDYAQTADVVACAIGNTQILQFILDTGNVSTAEKNEYLEQFIKDEIQKPNREEQDLYDEIRRNEMIIEYKGRVDEANQRFEEYKTKRENDFEMIRQMNEWIYVSLDDQGVNPQVRKNLFTLTLDLQTDAVHQYADSYRRRLTHRHPAVMGEYSTEIDFCNRAGEGAKIQEYYEIQRQEQLKQIKNTTAVVGAVLAVLGVAGIFLLGPLTLIISGIGGGCIALNFLSNSRQKKQIDETCAMNIRGKEEQMTQLFREYEQMMRIYEYHDAYLARIDDELRRF
ncbi:MAG: hypothetical protein Q4B22_09470 [Eubacteriales bacterium]|nr:hypothetical protein [Eubacteriales bacterium]